MNAKVEVWTYSFGLGVRCGDFGEVKLAHRVHLERFIRNKSNEIIHEIDQQDEM